MNKKISISKTQTRSGLRWQVRHLDPDSLKVKRPCFISRAEAEAFAEAMHNRNTSAVAQFALLPQAMQSHLLSVYGEAQKRRVDLMAAVIQAVPVLVDKVTLRMAINELIGAKRKAGRDTGYVDNLENLLWRFARDRDNKPIESVDVKFIEAFLEASKIESRSTLRSRLSTLFNFAVRRKFLVANPCNQLERVTVTRPPARVMSVAEVQSALAFIKNDFPRLATWFVLSTFCGLRPEEAQLTTPKEIHFKEGWVKVEAQTTKVRMRRVVYPRREAMGLLQAAVRLYPAVKLSDKVKRRGQRLAAKAFHWPEWYQDVTRHSAASYWLAIEPDVAKVAAMLGNSPAVLLKHYKALVTKKEAKKFWKLTF